MSLAESAGGTSSSSLGQGIGNTSSTHNPRRRLALLEWSIETRAKRVLTLPRIIHPENVEMKTVVASRGQRMNSHSAAGGVGASPGLNCKNLLNKAIVRSCRKNRKTR